MANAKRCDLCGKFYMLEDCNPYEGDNPWFNRIILYCDAFNEYSSESASYDLCPKCRNAIQDKMQELLEDKKENKK